MGSNTIWIIYGATQNYLIELCLSCDFLIILNLLCHLTQKWVRKSDSPWGMTYLQREVYLYIDYKETQMTT